MVPSHIANDVSFTPHIIYEYSDPTSRIWFDINEHGTAHVSFWRIRAELLPQGFCFLGNVAVTGLEMPEMKMLMVAEKVGGALVHPTRFVEIWNDTGRRTPKDCTIYRMEAPPGYTCLGHVAVGSYKVQPTTDRYCCVNNRYVVEAEAKLTYHDSGPKQELTLWTPTPRNGDSRGLFGGNFIAGPDSAEAPTVYLLANSSPGKIDF